MSEAPTRADPPAAPTMQSARRGSALRLEIAVLAGLTGLAAAAFVWTQAPLYNPSGTIDPWLYTALWQNFGQIYHAFSTTYYAARLPWIVPGLVAYSVFSPRVASFVLHVPLFLAGGALVYAMCRRRFSLFAAATAYIALIGNQFYYGSERWDYVEGGTITFLIAAVAFAMLKPAPAPSRAVSLGASGFFAAALLGTRIGDVIYLLGIPLVYWATMLDEVRSDWPRALARDVRSWLTGAAALVVPLGVFALANGGRFFFFMPQITAIQGGTGESNHLPVHVWLPREPSFWAPIFVAVLGLLCLLVGPQLPRPARRLQIAALAWLGCDLALVALWEFGAKGWIFETRYYFSSFLVPTVFCFAGAVEAVVAGRARAPRSSLPLLALVGAAALGPLLWFFRTDSESRTADGFTHPTYMTALVAISAALGVALAAQVWGRAALAVLAVLLGVFAISFSFDGSLGAFGEGVSNPRTGALYDLGAQEIAFLRQHGYSHALPHFWYDQTGRDGNTFISLQSLYYYSYTYVGVNMPTIDNDFRRRLRAFNDPRLVLICPMSTCDGAPQALARHGLRPRLELRRRLHAGPLTAWFAIYKVRLP